MDVKNIKTFLNLCTQHQVVGFEVDEEIFINKRRPFFHMKNQIYIRNFYLAIHHFPEEVKMKSTKLFIKKQSKVRYTMNSRGVF